MQKRCQTPHFLLTLFAEGRKELTLQPVSLSQ